VGQRTAYECGMQHTVDMQVINEATLTTQEPEVLDPFQRQTDVLRFQDLSPFVPRRYAARAS